MKKPCVFLSLSLLLTCILALYDTCLRTYLSYNDLMLVLLAVVKHGSRVESTWIAFPHSRSAKVELLLRYKM